MEESSTKVGLIKKDIISELPRNVQETILCFLPIVDAVRTSVLSKKWRHCWTMMPHLIFYLGFAKNMMYKLSECYDDDKELMAYKFVSVINKTILLHTGPILKFSLTLPADECDAQIIHDYIDQWILLLSIKGVKQLVLEDSTLREVSAHHFSSLDLTDLRLFNVWFRYTPTTGRFTNLKNLELTRATFDCGQSIFDCPVLEKLTLICCKGLSHTNFRAPNLKCLRRMFHQTDFETLYTGLENLSECSYMLSQRIILREAKTSNVVKGTLMEAKTSNVVKFLGSLHKIEKLSIGLRFIKYLGEGGCPSRLSKPLPFLKTLEVSGISFTHLSEVSCLLCMIRSAPNLSKLYISAGYYCDEGDLKNYLIEVSEDCTTMDHLEYVTFSYFNGLKTELELVKFVLSHSPLLKTLFIHRSKTIEIGVALTMTEEILQYPRASTRAQIRHLKDCVETDDLLWDTYDPWIWC